MGGKGDRRLSRVAPRPAHLRCDRRRRAGHCFPPNLATGGAEPLAADLRPHADGRRLGFLKLVAGLSGVGLDALVQRDAQRRLRRVTAVTAAALAAMLVMAVLTGLALSQRREAQRQRAEAEGLVEFMLTDLRDKLKGVGRLDVLPAVNERALTYYRKQDLASLPPSPSNGERAFFTRWETMMSAEATLAVL